MTKADRERAIRAHQADIFPCLTAALHRPVFWFSLDKGYGTGGQDDGIAATNGAAMPEAGRSPSLYRLQGIDFVELDEVPELYKDL